MSKEIDKQLAIRICRSALLVGQPETAKKFNISKQRVNQIFHRQKSRVLFQYELTDSNGKPRSFNELRKIYNSFSI